MAMITVTTSGNFDNTERFLRNIQRGGYAKVLDKYGKRGVQALSSATPVDSGNTAASWSYEVHRSGGSYEIVFSNSNVNEGVNVAVILQYGHGTGTGGYVTGIDYINPALRPVFEAMADEAWKEVNR